jgi:hypothetical protein
VETLINPFGDERSAINIRKAMESIAPNDKKWLTKKKIMLILFNEVIIF